MPQLFPEWSDTTLRVTTVVLALLALGAVLGPWIYVRTPFHRNSYDPIAQPVEFDHRHHVGDDGIDCLFCHATADRAATAGLPSTDLCMGCHGQIWNESPMLEPVRRSFFSGMPLRWRRVYKLPRYVYFDHSIHYAKGIACIECHGRVDRMARVYQVASLTMAWCLDCHRNPVPHVRPVSAATEMEWHPDSEASNSERIAQRLEVRSKTDCYACHR